MLDSAKYNKYIIFFPLAYVVFSYSFFSSKVELVHFEYLRSVSWLCILNALFTVELRFVGRKTSAKIVVDTSYYINQFIFNCSFVFKYGGNSFLNYYLSIHIAIFEFFCVHGKTKRIRGQMSNKFYGRLF